MRRLDRYLSNVTVLSRSQAQKAIRGGRVTLDGDIEKRPSLKVSPDTIVALDGKRLVRPGYRYFMLHKPGGYVCATKDRQHSTVLELLHEPVISGLHIAGRLDIDTTGLVLITDDGAWSHRILAPSRHCPKTYLVTLAESLPKRQAHDLSQGIQLRNEARATRPAELTYVSETQVRITITEGRYHQVKRMFAAVGNRVIKLHREQIGGIYLDPGLAPGGYRALTDQETALADWDCGG